VLSPRYEKLKEIGIRELGVWLHEVQNIATPSGVVVKLRFWLITGDFVDAYAAQGGRFACHFEGRSTQRGIYRHDNAPHGSAASCPTYPRHCHSGAENNIAPSYLSDDLPAAFRSYCNLLLRFLEDTVPGDTVIIR
jgi:hypothetical protein